MIEEWVKSLYDCQLEDLKYLMTRKVTNVLHLITTRQIKYQEYNMLEHWTMEAAPLHVHGCSEQLTLGWLCYASSVVQVGLKVAI